MSGGSSSNKALKICYAVLLLICLAATICYFFQSEFKALCDREIFDKKSIGILFLVISAVFLVSAGLLFLLPWVARHYHSRPGQFLNNSTSPNGRRSTQPTSNRIYPVAKELRFACDKLIYLINQRAMDVEAQLDEASGAITLEEAIAASTEGGFTKQTIKEIVDYALNDDPLKHLEEFSTQTNPDKTDTLYNLLNNIGSEKTELIFIGKIKLLIVIKDCTEKVLLIACKPSLFNNQCTPRALKERDTVFKEFKGQSKYAMNQIPAKILGTTLHEEYTHLSMYMGLFKPEKVKKMLTHPLMTPHNSLPLAVSQLEDNADLVRTHFPFNEEIELALQEFTKALESFKPTPSPSSAMPHRHSPSNLHSFTLEPDKQKQRLALPLLSAPHNY
jgi:hypothetical protein